MPKVSVIIPVYNVEKYLRQCLDSVVNQTLEDIEIICVNDCSPDNSISILNEYASKDNRIRIIDLKENGGHGNARNMAMKEVTSDYMMFLDSDDWLELNACELAYNQITKNGNDFVLFGLYTYNEKKDIKHQNKTKLALFLDYKELSQVTTKDLKGPFFAYAQSCFKIYNTHFIRKNNIFFDSGYYEDQIFNVKLFSLVNNFSVLNVPLYNYRKHEGSVVNSMNSWDDCVKKRLNAYEYLKSINSPYISEYILSTVKMLLIFFKRFSKNRLFSKRKAYKNIYDLFVLFEKDFKDDFVDYSDLVDKYNLIIHSSNYFIYKINKFLKNK